MSAIALTTVEEAHLSVRPWVAHPLQSIPMPNVPSVSSFPANSLFEERTVSGASLAAYQGRTQNQTEDIELTSIDTRHSGGTRLRRDEPGPDATAAFTMSLKMERVYLAVLCWFLFLEGWNDGTLGPLLPRIQEHYGLNFVIVSLLFICNCIGFVSGALANVQLTEKLGFGKILVTGATFQVIAYSIQAPAPPFPLLCTSYFINGVGMALQNAQANAFVASIPRNQSTNMGILHAVYGLGAFAAPLASTRFAQLPHWSFHYLVAVGISLVNLVALAWTFKLKPQNHFLPETHSASTTTGGSQFGQILGKKIVHALAFFIFVYVGVEVSIGGWIVTYLIDERGGGPSAGYAASGFFGGLTLGRIGLLWVNKKVGERRVIYIYLAVCALLEFTVWFVPNLVGNAVAVSIVGMALGPIYPIIMNLAGGILPRKVLAGSIGWIAGFGQAGSAVFPFMTGAMAQHHGVLVLQPLLIGMLAFLTGLWVMVNRSKLDQRSD